MMKYKLLGIAIILVIWSSISYFGLINPLFVPKPHEVIIKLGNLLVTKRMYYDLLSTLARTISGFLIGAIFGVIIGFLIGASPKALYLTELLIDFCRSLPGLIIFTLFILFFGLGDGSKIITVGFVTSLIVIVNTTYGMKSVKKTRLLFARTLKLNKFEQFRKIVLPETLPSIFSACRITLSLSLATIVAIEMLVGTKFGIGIRVYETHYMYKTAEMYALIIITGFIGYSLNKLLLLIEKKRFHWVGN